MVVAAFRGRGARLARLANAAQCPLCSGARAICASRAPREPFASSNVRVTNCHSRELVERGGETATEFGRAFHRRPRRLRAPRFGAARHPERSSLHGRSRVIVTLPDNARAREIRAAMARRRNAAPRLDAWRARRVDASRRARGTRRGLLPRRPCRIEAPPTPYRRARRSPPFMHRLRSLAPGEHGPPRWRAPRRSRPENVVNPISHHLQARPPTPTRPIGRTTKWRRRATSAAPARRRDLRPVSRASTPERTAAWRCHGVALGARGPAQAAHRPARY